MVPNLGNHLGLNRGNPALGLRVWLDEFELTLGDSLRRKIDYGLAGSRYGVVVLSSAFFSKEWPQRELDGLFAREDGREKVILPIWHNVTASDVARFSPMLADKVAVSTSLGLAHVAATVFAVVRSKQTKIADQEIGVQDARLDALERIRRDVLTSDSSRELRRSQYKLEALLARYPHSVEGRELHDQLTSAIRRAEAYETPAASLLYGPRALRAVGWGIFLAVAAWVVYETLRLLRVI